jgi:hypothetical protein
MLVIPALISLKPQILDKCAPEAVEMLQRIIKRIRDPQEIVAKTARKLLIELQKCYPVAFENQMINSLKVEEDKIICKAVLRNDEDEIQRILNISVNSGVPTVSQGSRRSLLDDQKSSQTSYITHLTCLSASRATVQGLGSAGARSSRSLAKRSCKAMRTL